MIITWNELMNAKKPVDTAWRLRCRLESRVFGAESCNARAYARLKRALARVEKIEKVRLHNYNIVKAKWVAAGSNATRQIAEVR